MPTATLRLGEQDNAPGWEDLNARNFSADE